MLLDHQQPTADTGSQTQNRRRTTVARPFIPRTLAALMAALLAIPAAGTQAQAVLEEVLVTAQKREESQQDVPISINALSGDQLQSQNLNEMEAFSFQTPNLHISESAIGDKLFIRGIGSGINSGFEQSVGTFIDGVYYGRSLQTRSQFLDVERVEVLRGPQSTYFGNNAIAGALNITTRKPDGENSGYLNSYYEFEHNEYHLEGAAQTALSDTLAVRVAGLYSGLDGWVTNLNTGQTEGDEENNALRVVLAFNPADSFDATLKLETGSFEVRGRNLQVLNCPPATGPAGTCDITTAPVLERFGPAFAEPLYPDFNDNFDLNTQYNGPVPEAFTTAVDTLGALEAGLPVPPPMDSLSARDLADLQNNNATLSMRWQLGSGLVVNSVTGYSEYEFDFLQTTDFVPIPTVGLNQMEDFKQYSQELRISSLGGQTVDWMVGVYYQNNKLQVNENVNLYLPPPYFQPASTYFTDTCRLPASAGNRSCRPPATIGSVFSEHAQEEQSVSVFASATWYLSDRLRATLGARYMAVDKDLERTQTLIDGAPGITVSCLPALASAVGCIAGAPLLFTAPSPPLGTAFGWGTGSLSLSHSDSEFMPSVNLQYELDADMMVYGVYSRGFKAGGFDQRNLYMNAQTGQFGPEQVDAVELGFKSMLLDGDMRLNLSVFRSEYDDLQVSTFDGVVNFLVNNAASARTQGIEAELNWLLNDTLMLTGNLALLDAEWQDFRLAQCTALGLAMAPGANCNVDPASGLLVQDLSGESMLMAPDYSGNLGLEHFLPMPNGLELQTQLLVYFEGDKYLAADNDPATRQDSFYKVNLRIALVSDTGWELALVGRNLNDELTSGHSEDLPLGSVNSFFRLTDRPRTVSLQAQYHW